MKKLTRMKIHCCNCKQKVKARLTDGKEIYPHRADLATHPFWKCDTCAWHVGCHRLTKNPTRPLGCIPSREIKNARQHIRAILDPIWQSKLMGRAGLYKMLSKRLGYTYHTAEIRDIEEARRIYREIQSIKRELAA